MTIKEFDEITIGKIYYDVYDFEYHEEHSLQELADTLGVDKNYIKEIK